MPHILMLIDSNFRYEPPSPSGWDDFTFVRLVEIFTDAGFQVTKAHRENDGTADIDSFTFDAPDANLDQYDVVWMMGIQAGSGDNLPHPEIAALEAFMDAGGGVFATGDHESLGASMCGRIPRVRLMRAWFGANNAASSPMSAIDGFPTNFDQVGGGRGDTLQRNPAGTYDTPDSVWFENQSDSVPQPLSPTTAPAHPILRHEGRELVVYADHMHEGQTLGPEDLDGIYNYATNHPLDDGSGRSVVDFPVVDGHRELPLVIATGQTTGFQLGNANAGTVTSGAPTPKTINTLCVYDGLVSGRGRVVTSSTWHHYIDINLDGASGLTEAGLTNAGPDAEKGKGFFGTAAAAGVYDDIKQVFVNIANWLAKPRPNLQLILERSTISQDEATADPEFDNAILVTVDGVRPGQFPNGPITSLGSPPQLVDWAPTVTFPDGSGLAAVPTKVDSDDPSLSDRLQRFTFSYRVEVDVPTAFSFNGEVQEFGVIAALTPVAGDQQTDSAIMQLVTSANPFMLDLANGNTTTWLSSDLRVFPVVTGRTMNGKLLPLDATRAQALDFLRSLVDDLTVTQFESLAMNQAGSALSPLPTTTGSGRRVYNFAIARVRLNGSVSVADDVRVFFRIFTSQTTAGLRFSRAAGEPSGGYRQTAGGSPIALPSPDSSGSEWLSIPMFSATRTLPPDTQTDPDNHEPTIGPAGGSEISTFFGALIDNNLDGAYLPENPNSGGPAVSVRDLLHGEHQCLVAQVEHAGTPIPTNATPSTSDKLSQRNIALSEVANPGKRASRVALHTFEIERTQPAINDLLPPDELVLSWPNGAPAGTHVEISISTWRAQEVVDLADLLYARHDIAVVDEHTVSISGDGTRYVPIPQSNRRQVGLISAHLPLGITSGERYDLSIRQVTNRSRKVNIPKPKVTRLSTDEALAVLEEYGLLKGKNKDVDDGPAMPVGAFPLGDRRTLVTDLRLLDDFGEGAVLIEEPDPDKVAAAVARAGRWRELVGAFQLGIPVSTRGAMLNYQLRLLSVMQWRLESLPVGNRWFEPLARYVAVLVEKVRALGGRPELVPATPDGIFDLEDAGGTPDGGRGEDGDGGDRGPGADDPSELEPAEDWLGEPGPPSSYLWSGKVSGLLYDHFGDFEGFTLERYNGDHVRFFSREESIRSLVVQGWQERFVVTVVSVSDEDRTVVRLLLRGYS